MAQSLYNGIDCTPVVDLVVPTVDSPSGCSSLDTTVASWIELVVVTNVVSDGTSKMCIKGNE